MLSEYCQNILRTELAKTDYDGISVEQAWAWLTQTTAQPPLVKPSGLMLTPLTAAGLLGPDKAEAVAAAIKAKYPTICDHLLDGGVDPANAATQTFLAGLVADGVLTQQDVATVAAAATVLVPQPTLPARMDRRFDPQQWPHVAADGTAGKDSDGAIHGFPNALERADFDAAWSAAGRQ